MTEILYEKKPKEPDSCSWVAPEHRQIAKTMLRDKRGMLIIEPNPIFRYSQQRPPAFLVGNLRGGRR